MPRAYPFQSGFCGSVLHEPALFAEYEPCGVHQSGTHIEYVAVDHAREQERRNAQRGDDLFRIRAAETENERLHAMHEIGDDRKRAARGNELEERIVRAQGKERSLGRAVHELGQHSVLRHERSGRLVEPDAEAGVFEEALPAGLPCGKPRRIVPTLVDDGREQIFDLIAEHNGADQHRDEQHRKDDGVPEPLFFLAADERNDHTPQIDDGAEQHRPAALRDHDAEIEHRAENGVRPAVLVFDGEVDGRGHTHRHHAADVVVDAPARVEHGAVDAAVRGDDAFVEVHPPDFGKQPRSDDGDDHRKIGLRHIFPADGIIKEEIKPAQGGDLHKAHQHRPAVVIGRARAAQKIRRAQHEIACGKFGDAALFADADEHGDEPSDEHDRNDGDRVKERELPLRLTEERIGEFPRVVLGGENHISAAYHRHDAKHIVCKEHDQQPEREVRIDDENFKPEKFGACHKKHRERGKPARTEKIADADHRAPLSQLRKSFCKHENIITPRTLESKLFNAEMRFLRSRNYHIPRSRSARFRAAARNTRI